MDGDNQWNHIEGNPGAITYDYWSASQEPVTITFNKVISNTQVSGDRADLHAMLIVGCDTTITNNDLADNLATYPVASLPGDCEILATDNWWGTTDVADIGELINDYYDDFQRAKVIFQPFSIGPNLPVP